MPVSRSPSRPSELSEPRLRARLERVDRDLSIDRFVDPGSTPGNVGVCISGGGSRSMVASMGQLRGLRFLRSADGRSLLEQVRALSVVSGSSWLGVPFTYLPEGVTDDDALGVYVGDLSRLVASRRDDRSAAETLDELPPGNLCQALTSPLFGGLYLGLEMLLLHEVADVPPDMLWQTLIGLHILRPYGLFDLDEALAPTALFSFDADTLQRDVTGPNPALATRTAHLVASGEGRRRPFLVCHTAMFLRSPDRATELLAPVQATPIATGIFGSPAGQDANGLRPGGGGVTSFAFASRPLAVAGDEVVIEQQRPLALSDLIGASSAFFAEVLANQIAAWRDDVPGLIDRLRDHADTLRAWVERSVPAADRAVALGLLDRQRLTAGKGLVADGLRARLERILERLLDIIPRYAYWPVAAAAPAAVTLPTRFADGGNLDNSGVASMLAYRDLDRLIVFLNPATALAASAHGVLDGAGEEVAGTRIMVDSMVPPLFGYEPYDDDLGYVPYAPNSEPREPIFQHNQVFPAADFPRLLRGLWRAAGNEADPATLAATREQTRRGNDLHAAIFRQRLAVLDNAWFGVAADGGGRQVDVLWVYTNRVNDWFRQLAPQAQAILGPFADPSSFDGFPYFSTAMTQLNATQINLLASLTAWTVADAANRQAFLEMFES